MVSDVALAIGKAHAMRGVLRAARGAVASATLSTFSLVQSVAPDVEAAPGVAIRQSMGGGTQARHGQSGNPTHPSRRSRRKDLKLQQKAQGMIRSRLSFIKVGRHGRMGRLRGAGDIGSKWSSSHNDAQVTRMEVRASAQGATSTPLQTCHGCQVGDGLSPSAADPHTRLPSPEPPLPPLVGPTYPSRRIGAEGSWLHTHITIVKAAIHLKRGPTAAPESVPARV
jgi:hypothetical protein